MAVAECQTYTAASVNRGNPVWQLTSTRHKDVETWSATFALSVRFCLKIFSSRRVLALMVRHSALYHGAGRRWRWRLTADCFSGGTSSNRVFNVESHSVESWLQLSGGLTTSCEFARANLKLDIERRPVAPNRRRVSSRAVVEEHRIGDVARTEEWSDIAEGSTITVTWVLKQFRVIWPASCVGLLTNLTKSKWSNKQPAIPPKLHSKCKSRMYCILVTHFQHIWEQWV